MRKKGRFLSTNKYENKIEGTSFSDAEDITVIKHNYQWRLAKLKQDGLTIKKVAWCNDGAFIDDVGGEFVDRCDSEKTTALELSEGEQQFKFILQYRLELLTRRCVNLFWDSEERISVGDQENNYYTKIGRKLARFYFHRYGRTDTQLMLNPKQFVAVCLEGTIYTFPHHIFYLLESNLYKISEEFKKVLLFAKPISMADVQLYEPDSEREFYMLDSFIRFQSGQGRAHLFEIIRQDENAENQELHNEYEAPQRLSTCVKENYKQVNAELWMNLDLASNSIHDSYKMQPFVLPAKATIDELQTVLGRQSIDLLAIAEMSNAFKRLKELCEQDEQLATAISELMTNKQKMSAFTCSVNARFPNKDYRKTLIENSEKLFPF